VATALADRTIEVEVLDINGNIASVLVRSELYLTAHECRSRSPESAMLRSPTDGVVDGRGVWV
jgi:hypothetical protein